MADFQFPKNLIVSPSPHIAGAESVPRVMWTVVLALMPALIMAFANFGWYAMLVVGVSVAAAIVVEFTIQRARGMDVTISDGSAVVTGILLAMTLPPNVPLYIPLVGAAFAIGIAKHAFGGLGCNIWNPALAGRAFLLAAYSGQIVMSKWPVIQERFLGHIAADVITKATPCAVLKAKPFEFFEFYTLRELATGFIPGSIGETSAIALIIGGLFLIIRKVVNWRMPLSYILTVMIFVVLMPMKDGQGGTVAVWQPAYWQDPVFVLKFALAHALSGGLMIGAFFMATDMVTSPLTSKGQAIFGIGCGVLVGVIRLWGGYPEGVCYSILIMNTFVWLLDRVTKPKFFGETVKEKV
ncbi:MAG: RnfABCDGE type electron transport complex subunit D [candidate division Zixibacteria bacterium]|nr:RnfABCDGE type electron transport complex subunit D [candidate division Zixibacteria bacterium]